MFTLFFLNAKSVTAIPPKILQPSTEQNFMLKSYTADLLCIPHGLRRGEDTPSSAGLKRKLEESKDSKAQSLVQPPGAVDDRRPMADA